MKTTQKQSVGELSESLSFDASEIFNLGARYGKAVGMNDFLNENYNRLIEENRILKGEIRVIIESLYLTSDGESVYTLDARMAELVSIVKKYKELR